MAINLVNEAHNCLKELRDTRKKFNAGKISLGDAKVAIGFFNASRGTINTAISAEKWSKSKARKK